MTWGQGYKQPGNWRGLVKHILHRDQGICYVCGRTATTADHVIPISQGGTHDQTNLAAICADCHRAKTERERRFGMTQARQKRQHRAPREPHPNAPRP